MSKYPDSTIVITGHSLGAALATLTAYDMASVYGTKVSMINFGSPRVGNGNFANVFNHRLANRAIRVTHALDPIT